jgi:toxin-antitoxin system PIN domain toxin
LSVLLDVNLLMSLAWPNHVHHEIAHGWFRERGRASWATTPVTENGFVRVSSNRAALPTAVTPPEAWSLLEKMRKVGGHVFLPDDVELVVGDEASGASRLASRVVSHRLVTDAHLLAVARRHRFRLATFDRGVAALAGPERDLIELVTLR